VAVAAVVVAAAFSVGRRASVVFPIA